MNPGIQKTQARFCHPSEFGLSYPINTPAELYNMTRDLNRALIAGQGRNIVGVITKDGYKRLENPAPVVEQKKSVCIQGADGVWRPEEE